MSENKTKFKVIEEGSSCNVVVTHELYTSLKNALFVNINSYENKKELDEFMSDGSKEPKNYLQSNIYMYLYLIKLFEDSFIASGNFVEKEYTDQELKTLFNINQENDPQN